MDYECWYCLLTVKLFVRCQDKQRCEHGGVLAVNECVCNCSEGVQMLHAETVGCVADPTCTHTPGSGHTIQLNIPEIITSYITHIPASFYCSLLHSFYETKSSFNLSLWCENKVCLNDHSVLTGAENTAWPLITVFVTSAVLKKSKSQSPPALHLSSTSSLHQLHRPQCQRTSTADN